jgi:hypothetical protein
MDLKNNKSLILYVLMTLILLTPQRAYAYIDPNAGGFFFTSVLPFVYGILATIVIFWKRIANVFKGIFSWNKNKSGN